MLPLFYCIVSFDVSVFVSKTYYYYCNVVCYTGYKLLYSCTINLKPLVSYSSVISLIKSFIHVNMPLKHHLLVIFFVFVFFVLCDLCC